MLTNHMAQKGLTTMPLLGKFGNFCGQKTLLSLRMDEFNYLQYLNDNELLLQAENQLFQELCSTFIMDFTTC